MAGVTAAASHHIAARALLAPDQLSALRERVEWKGFALIAHAWFIILGSMALVVLFPNPLTYRRYHLAHQDQGVNGSKPVY